MLMAIAIVICKQTFLTFAVSDLLFFRLEKLCPPDGSKVRFAKIKTLMQQYDIFVLQKMLTLMLKKQKLLRLRH